MSNSRAERWTEVGRTANASANCSGSGAAWFGCEVPKLSPLKVQRSARRQNTDCVCTFGGADTHRKVVVYSKILADASLQAIIYKLDALHGEKSPFAQVTNLGIIVQCGKSPDTWKSRAGRTCDFVLLNQWCIPLGLEAFKGDSGRAARIGVSLSLPLPCSRGEHQVGHQWHR